MEGIKETGDNDKGGGNTNTGIDYYGSGLVMISCYGM